MKFYYGDITLEIPDGIYYPREDSELMAKTVETIQLEGKKLLEIGCGSGLLSIIAAKKGADVTSADINPEALETARNNAELNRSKIDVVHSDLFSKVSDKFDIIIFNPPYLPVEEGEDDITYAGGLTGRETIEKFIGKAKAHLNPKGEVLMLISSLTGEMEVLDLFKKEGFHTFVVAREKISWEELIVIKAF